MKLFTYSVFYNPNKTTNVTDKVKKTTKQAKILVEPVTVLANDVNEVTILAARSIPSEYLNELSNVEIAVRPF